MDFTQDLARKAKDIITIQIIIANYSTLMGIP